MASLRGVPQETAREALSMPGTTVAQATWQRERAVTVARRGAALPRKKSHQGGKNAAFTKFVWVSFKHSETGWCVAFTYIPDPGG